MAARPPVPDPRGEDVEGARRIYEIDPKGLGTIRTWLDQFWDTALASFKDEIEGTKGKS